MSQMRPFVLGGDYLYQLIYDIDRKHLPCESDTSPFLPSFILVRGCLVVRAGSGTCLWGFNPGV